MSNRRRPNWAGVLISAVGVILIVYGGDILLTFHFGGPMARGNMPGASGLGIILLIGGVAMLIFGIAAHRNQP